MNEPPPGRRWTADTRLVSDSVMLTVVRTDVMTGVTVFMVRSACQQTTDAPLSEWRTLDNVYNGTRPSSGVCPLSTADVRASLAPRPVSAIQYSLLCPPVSGACRPWRAACCPETGSGSTKPRYFMF